MFEATNTNTFAYVGEGVLSNFRQAWVSAFSTAHTERILGVARVGAPYFSGSAGGRLTDNVPDCRHVIGGQIWLQRERDAQCTRVVSIGGPGVQSRRIDRITEVNTSLSLAIELRKNAKAEWVSAPLTAPVCVRCTLRLLHPIGQWRPWAYRPTSELMRDDNLADGEATERVLISVHLY